MDLNETVVTIDGKDIVLNNDQLRQIREQFRIQEAYSTLCCHDYDDDMIEEMGRDILLRIGDDLDDALSNNIGGIESDIIDNYVNMGLIPDLHEDEDDEEEE